MFRKIAIATLVLHGAPVSAAETLSDPMRPWQPAPVAAERGPAVAQYELSAILYSPERRVAVVNGRSVGEGDRVGNAKVRRIGRRSLDLEVDGKTHTLALAGTRPKRSGSKQ